MYNPSNFWGALQRGWGCVTPVHCHLKPKAVTQSLRNTSSPNRSKNISPHTAPLTITHPSIPSREGNPTRHKSLITNKKTAFQTSPLERGWGCVTSVHSFLKSKATTQSRQILHNSTNNNKCNISQQLSKNISPHAAPLTVTHPLNPLSRGEFTTP